MPLSVDERYPDPGQVPLHPADELRRVRLEIRHLREREAALRAALLQSGDFFGREWEVVPTPTVSWRIDRAKLPREIVEDPHYVRKVSTLVLRLVPAGWR
ncbi:MAG: hypothetical protein ACFBSD_03085 [Paracoccaceae bacterium]